MTITPNLVHSMDAKMLNQTNVILQLKGGISKRPIQSIWRFPQENSIDPVIYHGVDPDDEGYI